MPTLQAFTPEEKAFAKRILSTQVASMMGRKLEEGDWSHVYCKARGLPNRGWSNLHIDVSHDGFGLELKLLRIPGLNGRPLKSCCGMTLMHPSSTRSIRIDAAHTPERALSEVFTQYAKLISDRRDAVQRQSPDKSPDMRTGWLLWEDNLIDFLYFEEPMVAPDLDLYRACWSDTPARGARKASRSLWIYNRVTNQKRFSITTSAGPKIQPYFDVPAPDDENLVYLRAQSEVLDERTIKLWISAATARALDYRLGGLDCQRVSDAFIKAVAEGTIPFDATDPEEGLAVGLEITQEAYNQLTAWEAVSDEHRAQLLLKTLN